MSTLRPQIVGGFLFRSYAQTLALFVSLCALYAFPASGSIANWSLNSTTPGKGIEAIRALSNSSAFSSLGLEKQVIDSTQQSLFRKTRGNNEDGDSSGLTTALDNAVADAQEEPGTSSLQSIHPSPPKRLNESSFLVASNAPSRPATELDEAMARTAFNEEFVSVPTIQFASLASGSAALSAVPAANVGVVPVPEIRAFFPIVGLIVAVFCTQILRRRRAAQQSTFRR